MSVADVLIVCGGGYISGKEIMALTLARGLAGRGAAVAVASSRWTDGEFGRRLQQASIAQVVLPLGFYSTVPRWELIRMTAEQLVCWPVLLWKYARVLRSMRPRRVVHTNLHHVLLLWPFLDRRRDVFWLHELVPDVPRYRRLFRWLARRMHSIVAISHAAAGSLARSGVDAGKIVTIHNGIPEPASELPPPEAAGGAARLAIVGQVGAWKGHDDLLDALSMLADRHPALTLKIFGSGEPAYAARLQRRIRDLRLDGKVQWMGFVKDPMEIYAQVDICVVPSRFQEPLSITAIEAGRFGRPVVATARGGLPEVVEDGVTGLLVPAEAPAILAQALDRLVRDPALARAMGDNARARTRRLFMENRFIDEFSKALA